jgi:U2 small nuclear ribonucleoprotein A'
MPRLTSELVASSPQFMNPLKERELDLRGNSIPAIENLGAARVRHLRLRLIH